MTRAWEWFALGGPVMGVLALLSIAVITLTIIKLWEFSEARIWRREFVEPALDALDGGRPDHARALLGMVNGPLPELMAEAIAASGDHAAQQERIARRAADRLESLRNLLRPLEVIATLAPLLGLLGTVLGMIEVFRRLQAAGDRVDASILSGGLWEALLTTAAGLAVCIVALAVFHFLDRQVERLHHALESALTRIFAIKSRG